MKEIQFKDRVSTYPGRVVLTPVEGAVNTFDLVRADEPTEAGSPLDKATFNSIIHSRLTGRYYNPAASRVRQTQKSGVTTSPIPTSGWVFDVDDTNRATSGSYVVTTSSNNGDDWDADGAFRTTGWQSAGGDSAWIEIYQPQPIEVINMRFAVEFQYVGRFVKLQIQGSNDGELWVTLGELTSIASESTIEYVLATPGEYTYYRLYFTNSDSNRVIVKNLSYSKYNVYTYSTNYTLADVPTQWTKEQRLMLLTPNIVDSFGVTSNTLNGIPVNTILQAGKRYELRYNGAAFDVKEV